MMVKWIKRILGIDAASKIRTIVTQFSTQFLCVVDNLYSAVSDIDGDITDNQIEIQTLKTENARLGNAKCEALGLIRDLKELLGE